MSTAEKSAAVAVEAVQRFVALNSQGVNNG